MSNELKLFIYSLIFGGASAEVLLNSRPWNWLRITLLIVLGASVTIGGSCLITMVTR